MRRLASSGDVPRWRTLPMRAEIARVVVTKEVPASLRSVRLNGCRWLVASGGASCAVLFTA